MTDMYKELLAPATSEEFIKLLKERTNGLPVNPDLAESVSLLPINEEEAKSIRAQTATLQKSLTTVRETLANVQEVGLQAAETATIARRIAEGTNTFSDRILQLEFKLSRALEALAANNIEVDFSARNEETSE